MIDWEVIRWVEGGFIGRIGGVTRGESTEEGEKGKGTSAPISRPTAPGPTL